MLLHLLALLLYAASGVLWLRSLLRGEPGRGAPAATLLAVVAVAAHAGALARYTVVWAELPLVGVGPTLSSMALVVAGFLLATAVLAEGERVGIVLVPIVVVLEGTALALGIEPAGEPLPFRGVWFALHVVLAFVGYGGLAVAFASGLLYLVQFRELKEKRLGRFFRFIPPLETLDLLGRVGLAVGFPALSAALVLAWAWTVRFTHSFNLSDPQVIWGVLTWFVFLAATLARASGGRAGRRGAMAAVIGFGLVVVSYLVLRLSLVGGESFL